MIAGRQLLLLAAALCVSAQSCAFTRHFGAHCQAPDGSLFVLRAQYQYFPIALGHSSPVSDVQDWEVLYKPHGARRLRKTPGTVRFSDPHQVDCSTVGVHNGVALVNQSYLRADGTWLPEERRPKDVPLSIAPRERPDAVQRTMAQLEVIAVDQFALLLPHGDRLVYEEPLLSVKESPNGRVAAVYTAYSTDGGLSWSALTISTAPKLFVLGKSTEEQPYAAKLIAGGTVGKR